MLSRIKFIPRDQLHQAGKSNSDSDGSDEERKVSSSRKGKHERSKKNQKKKRRPRYDSSDEDDDGSGREKGRSESESYSSLDGDEERRSKRRRWAFSEGSYSSEEYEKKKMTKKKERGRKHGKETRGKSYEGKDEFSRDEDDERDFVSQKDKELARKELGLEWMLSSGSRVDNNRAQVEDEPERPVVEEVKRTNPKELNPYLKDNGSGYPDDASISEGSNRLLSSSVVGDGGASWRLKALKRAKEQAAREGRKLDDVVGERWGSLNQLAASVTASGAASTYAHLRAIKDRKRGQAEDSDDVAKGGTKGGDEAVPGGRREYLRDVSSRHPEMRKPKRDSLSWKRNKGRNISLEDESLIAEAMSGLNKFANDGSFLENITCSQRKDAAVSSDSHANIEANDHRENELDLKEPSSSEKSSADKQVLSANQLAAKVLQLRMKGKHEEAEKLSKEMEAMVEKQNTGTKLIKQETERSTTRFVGRHISNEQKRREDDADLHLAKKIMQNRQYSLSGRADDEYDFDDAPSKRNRKKEKVPEEKRSIPKQVLTQQERCLFCFENPSRPKHLVVSIGNFTYLMLPQWQPVVQGHCCILPMQHEAATRIVDKNVWEELRNFKKCLLKMFARQDKDVVFLETVIGLAKQRRHCLIECIPMPYEVAGQAPLYFKKAIDEAEDEWGQHEMKKLIPTSGNLRQVIPANFAYFHVEFGLDRGFVHVIDDDSNFNSGFGLNVIRGLLRLPEEDMYRRRRHEPVEKQKQAVASFAREWEPFDWTKELD